MAIKLKKPMTKEEKDNIIQKLVEIKAPIKLTDGMFTDVGDASAALGYNISEINPKDLTWSWNLTTPPVVFDSSDNTAAITFNDTEVAPFKGYAEPITPSIKPITPPINTGVFSKNSLFQVDSSEAAYKKQIAEIVQLVSPWGYVAGGAARFFLMGGAVPDDIDVFLYEKTVPKPAPIPSPILDFTAIDTQSIPTDLHKALWLKYKWNHVSPNAVTYYLNSAAETYHKKPYQGYKPSLLPIQVIYPMEKGERITYGTPQDVIDCFTLHVEQFALWTQAVPEGAVTSDIIGVKSQAAVINATKKMITINKLDKPFNTLLRANKYIAKGFTIALPELAKVFAAWEKADPEYKKKVLSGNVDDQYGLLNI